MPWRGGTGQGRRSRFTWKVTFSTPGSFRTVKFSRLLSSSVLTFSTDAQTHTHTPTQTQTRTRTRRSISRRDYPVVRYFLLHSIHASMAIMQARAVKNSDPHRNVQPEQSCSEKKVYHKNILKNIQFSGKYIPYIN